MAPASSPRPVTAVHDPRAGLFVVIDETILRRNLWRGEGGVGPSRDRGDLRAQALGGEVEEGAGLEGQEALARVDEIDG